MKIQLSHEEITGIVEQHLSAQGVKIKPGSGTRITRTAGQYEDATTYVEGLAFELEVDIPKPTESDTPQGEKSGT